MAASRMPRRWMSSASRFLLDLALDMASACTTTEGHAPRFGAPEAGTGNGCHAALTAKVASAGKEPPRAGAEATSTGWTGATSGRRAASTATRDTPSCCANQATVGGV